MRNLDQKSENNWIHLVSSMNFDIYAIVCGISVHAIAEAKRSASFLKTLILVQSNLVISNSLISNYRLSRSENLVPVLT